MATREMAVINDSKTNDVYELRDKKLADAQVSTTPSDITVNSVVPVELEDGSCIKIKRDSLVQAFASVLNSNSQSTITTLFGADSNGNHANINMANLASVLSAPLRRKQMEVTTQSGVTKEVNMGYYTGIAIVMDQGRGMISVIGGSYDDHKEVLHLTSGGTFATDWLDRSLFIRQDLGVSVTYKITFLY